MTEKAPDTQRNGADRLSAVQSQVDDTRGDVADIRGDIASIKTDVAELRELVVERTQQIEQRLSMRIKWGDVAKGAGTFLGGVLVVLVPTQAEQIASIVASVIEVIQ